MAIPVSGVSLRPGTAGNGHATYKNLATVKALTDAPTVGVALPSWATAAIISIKNKSIYALSDGGTPDPATDEGVFYAVGNTFQIEGREQLLTWKMKEESATAVVGVEYFK